MQMVRAEASRYFFELRLVGSFAASPDQDWPETYRLAFKDELARLEDEHERSWAAVERAPRPDTVPSEGD